MTQEIQRALGRIEGKLDEIQRDQAEQRLDIKDLQAFKNKSLGIVGIIAASFGAFGSQLANWLHRSWFSLP